MSSQRRISIFGATGSIGQNTLDLVRRAGGRDIFDVVALTGSSNIKQLAEDAQEFDANFVVCADDAHFEALTDVLNGTRTTVLAGKSGLLEAAQVATDWAMSAIVGAAGLAPTMELAKSTTTLALANKESMVCAGGLLKAACAQYGCTLLPVDSEHSAIFQAMEGQAPDALERLILTASGGPFRGYSRAQLADVTLEQAKKHPNWDMGLRITIDSASMFNKALEIVEAKALFDVEADQIEVLVHPQSIIHSMVGLRDGALLAQLGPPDMRGAIGYALNWPRRMDLPVERLDFANLARLDFEAPDPEAFRSLKLADRVVRAGGASGAVFNAAKEAALDAFIAKQISFLAMADVVEETLDILEPKSLTIKDADGIDVIHLLDEQARQVAAQSAAKFSA